MFKQSIAQLETQDKVAAENNENADHKSENMNLTTQTT